MISFVLKNLKIKYLLMKLFRSIKLNSTEKLTLTYILISGIIAIFLEFRAENVSHLIFNRLIITGIILLMAFTENIITNVYLQLFRFLFIGFLLIYWYPETFEFNRLLENRDYLLALADQKMFGFQPSVLFKIKYPQHWFSELMNMGYFAFYPILVVSCLYFYFKDQKYARFFFFTCMFAFLSYYFIFIFFPTCGPQYYFPVIGSDNVAAGVFPHIANYFQYHPYRLEDETSTGLFRDAVVLVHNLFERPTGAFPSSHVGNTTLVMIMIIAKREYKFAALLSPIYIILVLSTVYIQAHYVIDIFAGFITAYLFYRLSIVIYPLFSKVTNKL